MKAASLVAWIVGPGLLAGCALGPETVRPEIAVAPEWKEPAPAAEPAAPRSLAWWTVFADPVLDELEEQLIAANPDIRQSAARIAEARALAGLARADRIPALGGSIGLERSQASANRARPAGPAGAAGDHAVSLDLAYEPDLWGRVRLIHEAARAEADAAWHDFHAVRLALTADAARAYLELRALDAEIAVITATLELRRDAARLQDTRFEAGLVNEMDATRAETEVAGVEAELHGAVRARARLEHALAVLAGRTPAGFALAPRSGGLGVPAIPAGLPSTLLARRPDVAVAAERLDAAAARVGAARADFLPRISLTGSAGFASADLSTLTAGDSRMWSFGPSVYLPFLDGGRNRANLAVAEARYEQAAAEFQGRALEAFREVEDALSDLGALAAQAGAVRRLRESAHETVALATERYRQGLSSYLEVVDAQRAVFQAERQGAQLEGARAVATVRLAKAVGGGWEHDARVALH